MVAVAGKTWKLAPSLVAFIDEIDKRWPGRPTASDGSIGDAGHAARVSDHNPDDDPNDDTTTRWVCAVDFTDNDPNGPIAWQVLDGIRFRKDHRCKYGISEGMAFYSYAKGDRPAWTWVKYAGPNGHFKHGHLSIHNTAAARNDRSSWLTAAPLPEEDDMFGDADRELLARINEKTEHNRWNRDLLDSISAAIGKIAAGDGASATEILDELAARLKD